MWSRLQYVVLGLNAFVVGWISTTYIFAPLRGLSVISFSLFSLSPTSLSPTFRIVELATGMADRAVDLAVI
jgi:hypothetical protein